MRKSHEIGIFSGRFDPPHLGHVMTIIKLSCIMDRLFVFVLNHPSRNVCPSDSSAAILKFVFQKLVDDGRVVIVLHPQHFGLITKPDWEKILSDLAIPPNKVMYYSGNPDVLKITRSCGILSQFVQRSFDWMYSGTIVRAGINNTSRTQKEKP